MRSCLVRFGEVRLGYISTTVSNSTNDLFLPPTFRSKQVVRHGVLGSGDLRIG